ncbi:hypothetical protein NicSoilC5_30380 [Arthrobacter sp. NicSoilC5]|nr:hypothetical protein NicSoilC5_30380 [Arthrobacter sp. NicSoilC5]
MAAETVTRFWLQVGVAGAVGDGVADAAEAEGVAAADGDAAGFEAVSVDEGWVEDAFWDPPVKAAASANPPATSAITSRSAPPTTIRRRRYTAALGFRTLLEPDAVPRADELPCLPILLG